MGSVRFIYTASLCVLLLIQTVRGQHVPQEMLKPENRTFSVSKQFTVFGGTKKVRGELAARAEELKSGALGVLQMKADWKWPVLIMVMPGDGARLRQAPVRVQVIDAGEAGRKVQIEIAPGGLDDREALDDALLRGIFAELAARDQRMVKGRFIGPPGWIVGAVTSGMRQENRGISVEVFNSLLEAGKLPKFERFLTQNPENLKGPSREVYGAQSLALFQGLVDSAGGRRKVVENLTLAEPAKDPVERFAQTWPELAKESEKLMRIWALGMAKMAAPKRTEFYTAAETGKRLGVEIEKIVQNPDGVEPGRYLLEMMKTPEGRFRLEAAATEVRKLGFKAHPLYASLVEEYRVMLDDLSRKRRKKFLAKFEEAEELRLALDSRSAEITDFLDHFQENEANGIVVPAAQLRPRNLPEKSSKRNDAITRYLDGIEQLGW